MSQKCKRNKWCKKGKGAIPLALQGGRGKRGNRWLCPVATGLKTNKIRDHSPDQRKPKAIRVPSLATWFVENADEMYQVQWFGIPRLCSSRRARPYTIGSGRSRPAMRSYAGPVTSISCPSSSPARSAGCPSLTPALRTAGIIPSIQFSLPLNHDLLSLLVFVDGDAAGRIICPVHKY